MTKLVSLACLITIVALMGAARADAPVTAESKTRHYRLSLQIGPTETMYSEAEAKTKHPTSGEIMLSGKMAAGMPGMSHAMPGMTPMSGMRHVELHVYALDSGKTITDARVTITLIGADKRRHTVSIARMYGVTEGLDDLHYGNNLPLSTGLYTIETTVNGEAARFSVTIPPDS